MKTEAYEGSSCLFLRPTAVLYTHTLLCSSSQLYKYVVVVNTAFNVLFVVWAVVSAIGSFMRVTRCQRSF